MKRRLKKNYTELYDKPDSLFPTCNVTLYPNGEREIWVQSKDGCRGMRIVVGEGSAGLSIRINRFAGSMPLTAVGNHKTDENGFALDDITEIAVCQYKSDEYSQQFKRWYMSDATDGENRPQHPEKMGLVPS